jgi:hypothetical protein
LLHASPACCCNIFFNSILNLCPSLNSWSCLMHLLVKLIVLLHSLSFPWHLPLSRIHVLGLGWDDVAWDGVLTSLHI